MNPQEYDRLLSGLHSYDEWKKLPLGDWILYGEMGSVSPKILLRPHRLVRSSGSRFRAVLSALAARAGVLGKRPPSLQGSNYEPEVPPEDMLAAWAASENQEHLVERIEQFKYASGFWVVCDAELPRSVATRLVGSAAYKAYLGERMDRRAVFDAMDTFLDDCGWFYVPLHEQTSYDLWVFGKDYADKGVLAVEKSGDSTAVHWEDGRAIWPDEPRDDSSPSE